MDLAAGEDADSGSAGEACFFDVDTEACEEVVACRGKRCEVGHLAAVGEGEAGGGGNVEDVFEPRSGDLFDDRRRGGVGIDGGVLVPCRGEEIGSECGGKGATDNPAEEAAASHPLLPAP
ncbi:MAG: hypothetical protein JWQ49_4611 [Edaphobacter sp.]|nr:hypothetical protein [Edaphobacter sp.]